MFKRLKGSLLLAAAALAVPAAIWAGANYNRRDLLYFNTLDRQGEVKVSKNGGIQQYGSINDANSVSSTTVNGSLSTTGNTTIGDAGTDALTVNASATYGSAATLTATSPSVQTLAAGTTISPAAIWVRLGAGSNTTMTATPTITTTSVPTGQYLILSSTASNITLQDQATLANTGLSLSAATLVVSTVTARSFIFTGTVWKQIN